ncbi:MAG: hypothetical protein KDB51_09980, partial [Propionibacteriaceae bacterium]|nr:hypothetical protein [Propionibacteriaceae bacterium]
AGMSGGVAFVLDLDRGRLNTEMVDPLEPSEAQVARIRELLVKHHEETGSAVAQRLLDEADLAARFTVVMPRDYARVVAAREEAEQAGLDEEATTAMMMEAAHG